MEITAAIKNALKELVVPELDKIKADVGETKAILGVGVTNKRIDDISTHMADLSRRIDENNKRINETNKRIDVTNMRIDETKENLGRLYEVIVRRDEHTTL